VKKVSTFLMVAAIVVATFVPSHANRQIRRITCLTNEDLSGSTYATQAEFKRVVLDLPGTSSQRPDFIVLVSPAHAGC